MDSIGPLDNEIRSYNNIMTISYFAYPSLAILTGLQILFYYLFNEVAHPFNEILDSFKLNGLEEFELTENTTHKPFVSASLPNLSMASGQVNRQAKEASKTSSLPPNLTI